MQFPLVAIILTTSAAFVGAQVTFNSTTDTFACPATGGAYCAGDSLSTNIIIRCTGTVGRAGNCNDNLAGVPPIGVKGFAPCYQSSPKAGDAACSFNGIVYPDNGRNFPVPGKSAAAPAPGNSTYFGNVTLPTIPPSNISMTIRITPTSTDYIIAPNVLANPSSPVMALHDQAAPTGALFPIPNSTTFAGGAATGSAGSPGTGKPTATFTGGTEALKPGALVLCAGIFAAVALL